MRIWDKHLFWLVVADAVVFAPVAYLAFTHGANILQAITAGAWAASALNMALTLLNMLRTRHHLKQLRKIIGKKP